MCVSLIEAQFTDDFAYKCALQWRHERDGVLNHQLHDCLLGRLFRRTSKKTSKLCVTGFCVGNSPVTGEFPTQMASNADIVSIWWRHHGKTNWYCCNPITDLHIASIYALALTFVSCSQLYSDHVIKTRVSGWHGSTRAVMCTYTNREFSSQ